MYISLSQRQRRIEYAANSRGFRRTSVINGVQKKIKEKGATQNLVEKADAGEDLLDALLELTVCSSKGNIGRVGDAAAAAAGS